MASIDSQTLRKAFGSFMTGVTVVTTRAANGELVGFTANSFTSVSMDPPLLLVCPGKHISSFEVFNQASYFSVSVLAEGQEQISNTFASASDERFAQVAWHEDENNCALIDGAVATFSCKVHQRHLAGDHMVLIGEVLQLTCEEKPALGYCSSGYFSLGKEQQSDASGLDNYDGVAGAIVEHGGRILMSNATQPHCVPTVKQAPAQGARSAVQQLFSAEGLTVELGPVYSIYDDPAQQTRFTFFRARSITDEAGNLGAFETIPSIEKLSIDDTAQATMMDRFVAESRIKKFGLYVGSADVGDLHILTEQQD